MLGCVGVEEEKRATPMEIKERAGFGGKEWREGRWKGTGVEGWELGEEVGGKFSNVAEEVWEGKGVRCGGVDEAGWDWGGGRRCRAFSGGSWMKPRILRKILAVGSKLLMGSMEMCCTEPGRGKGGSCGWKAGSRSSVVETDAGAFIEINDGNGREGTACTLADEEGKGLRQIGVESPA